MRISFIIPSRNNLTYLKQAVGSIQQCYGDTHDIVLLDDASTDGTWEWISSLEGDNIIKYRNESGERVGHTVLYDIGVKLSRTDVFSIFHADMITTPNHVPNSLKHLREGVVVSATRIEPPLHPPGPEKYVRSYGLEPSEFRREEFLHEVTRLESINTDRTTDGIFAPWMMYKSDFIKIGGHDLLFAPMELEDSDIFNRFLLQGYELKQSRDSFVYHMTCRGSRFKDGLVIEQEIPLPDGTIWYKPKDSQEYLDLRRIKFREWWRKWHCDVLHDSNMMPIVPNVYKTLIKVHNCTEELLRDVEPFADKILVDCDYENYINTESSKTLFDLRSRISSLSVSVNESEYDVILNIDGNNNLNFDLIRNISLLIQDSDEKSGEFTVMGVDVTLNIQDNFREKMIEKITRPLFPNVF